MTAVFYDGQNLHVDRRVIHDCYPTRVTDDGSKLFINDSNTIAIGAAGILPVVKII